MNYIMNIVEKVNGILWGTPTLVLLVGTGIMLTFVLGFIQIRFFPKAFSLMFSKKSGKGQISSFESLCVALSACIGTGNIIGVATAVSVGGAGALVWMVITAFVGMATIFGEATMAVKYRKVNKNGVVLGGPFFYIEEGTKQKWLAILFAIFAMAASALGIGNMSQIGSITSSVNSLTPNMAGMEIFGNKISFMALAVALVAVITSGMVIIGGIKSIAKIASKFVPVMGISYIVCGIVIIILNISKVPAAFNEIITSAFSLKSVSGGFMGSAMMIAINKGVSRGVFSNEAGLGSNPIAAAPAICKYPSEQGLVSMVGVFIDTCIICVITGLIIVMTKSNDSSLGLVGVQITNRAFTTGLSFAPWLGNLIVNGGLIIFSYTTILGWCYYGERSCAYLFGESKVIFFKIFYIVAMFLGIFINMTDILAIADMFNALMIIPNLIGILFLVNTIKKEKNSYVKSLK